MSDYSDYESCGEEDYDLDYESDYGCEMELEVEVPFKKNLSLAEGVPFILEGADSQVEVAEHFEFVFEQRFGETHPSFFRGSLKDANRAAFKTAELQKKPLALYLHMEGGNQKLPSQILTTKSVAEVLRRQFVVWGWDVSEANKAKLEQLMAEADMRRIYREINALDSSQFPLLVVVMAPKFIHQIVDKIDGQMSVDEAKSVLLNRLNSAVDTKNASSGVVFDAERAALLEEQRIAYERMLADDKAKREERERLEVMEQQKQEEEKRRIEEETRIEREKVEEAERKRKSIPEEPSPSEVNLVTVRLRLPEGKIENRRFRASEKVRYLVTFIESLGFSTESHDVFNSDRPRKRVTDFDQESSFQDVKWPKQEVVFVQEKF
ncbi:hypothetical protein L596_008951 [Steinernema carpocapsae]|uniref:UBX domain-containing protein n=1 Tax=Steinernema carpocapsae TaxID=34508 RepID=A0A4U5PEH3_STECR|nr:hypothetical protein L596_008951 [Steinernema carpocapsae]